MTPRSPAGQSNHPSPLSAVSDSAEDERRQIAITALRWTAALGFAATIALTYPLWVSSRAFPLTPVIEGMPALPPPIDHIVVALLLIALAGVALLKRPQPAALATLAIGALLALLDQSRWQPYFVELMVMVVSIALLPRDRADGGDRRRVHWALAPVRFLLVCTYLFAGLQKLNYDFATWLFPWFVEPLLTAVGIDVAGIPPALVVTVSIGAALFEAACGVLLLFGRTRFVGLVCATALHVLIMLVIGPLGHNNNAAVLPWNLALVAALWIVFYVLDPDAERVAPIFSAKWWRAMFGGSVPESSAAPRGGQRAGFVVVLLLAGILPLLGFFGGWDAYPSFALYSGNTHDGLFAISPEDVALLPATARGAMKSDGTFDPFRWAELDTKASMYPERRILINVGRSLAKLAQHDDVILRYTEPPDRLTGDRVARNLRFKRGTGDWEEIALPGER